MKEAGSSLTRVSQHRDCGVVNSVCSMNACSPWLFFLCCGSCSGSGWACSTSRQWHTHFAIIRICIGHVRQPLAKFLGVVRFGMMVPAARTPRSFLQQVKESLRIVKTIHEQDVVLVGCLGVHHKMVDNPAFGSKKGPVAILYPVGVDISIEDEACLGIAQQEALDAQTDRLVLYVLLDVKAVLGQKHALVSAELLAGL